MAVISCHCQWARPLHAAGGGGEVSLVTSRVSLPTCQVGSHLVTVGFYDLSGRIPPTRSVFRVASDLEVTVGLPGRKNLLCVQPSFSKPTYRSEKILAIRPVV